MSQNGKKSGAYNRSEEKRVIRGYLRSLVAGEAGRKRRDINGKK